MHDHIFALWYKPSNGGIDRIYALCEDERDVWDAVNHSHIPEHRLFLERWCIESTLEQMGEW